jgi:hypothetical protein
MPRSASRPTIDLPLVVDHHSARWFDALIGWFIAPTAHVVIHRATEQSARDLRDQIGRVGPDVT